MKRVFRVDYGALGAVERTPQGGLRIPATLTRTGVFEYTGSDGKPIREFRPPDEVFKADGMATLKAAPITLDHPPARIDPTNFRQFTMGHVGDDVRQDADKLAATLHVQDAEAIRSIEAGRRELSCGYHCDVDETPGVVPDGHPDAGKPYDRIQRGITYNHLALVDDGRAGHDVRLRLDSSGNQLHERKDNMKIEIIDGVEYEVGSAAHQAARERRDAREKTQHAAVDKMKSEFEKAQARADAAEAKHAKLADRVKKTVTPDRLDAAVRARHHVVTKATAILGKEFKADGLTNAAIKAAVVAKVYPHLRLDGKGKDYVNGLWHSITTKGAAERAERNDALNRIMKDTAPFPGVGDRSGSGDRVDAPQARTPAQARKDALIESEQRSSRPLALSRRDKFKPLSSHAMLQGAQMEVMK